jgi:hypothetical protein
VQSVQTLERERENNPPTIIALRSCMSLTTTTSLQRYKLHFKANFMKPVFHLMGSVVMKTSAF